MEFEIKGKKFEKQLVQKIAFSDLAKNTFCYSHIFFRATENSRPLLLKKAGEFLDSEFYEKYLKRGIESVYIVKTFDEKNILEIVNILEVFQKAILLEEKRRLKNELIGNVLQQKYTESDIHIAFHKVFNFLPEKFFVHYSKVSEEMLRRSTEVSLAAVFLFLLSDYEDFYLIKDVYNLSFLIDYGLINEEMSYDLIKACELERVEIGEGRKYLERKSLNKELDTFLNHPLKSYQKSKIFKNSFTYPELINKIEFHHERKDGLGFPRGIHYLFTSKIEQLINAVDKIIPFQDKILSKDKYNFNKILINLEEKVEVLGLEKIQIKIEKNWRVA